MGIFNITTKKELKNKIRKLEESIKAMANEIADLTEQRDNYEDTSKFYSAELKNLEEKYRKDGLEKIHEIAKLKGAIGGYKANTNKLKKQIATLEDNLNDALSDKYILHKVPSGRIPKTQVMSVKGSAKQSKIIKDLKKEVIGND